MKRQKNKRQPSSKLSLKKDEKDTPTQQEKDAERERVMEGLRRLGYV